MPPSIDTEKARKAASNPKRPGEQCRAEPASYIPVADYEELSFFGKLKSRAHGRKTAYTPGASACQACGLCGLSSPPRVAEPIGAFNGEFNLVGAHLLWLGQDCNRH